MTVRRLVVLLVAGLMALPAAAAAHERPPSLGPNVIVLDPSMTTSQIKATFDAIAAQQVSDQFGTRRYAILLEPGTYGTPSEPLNVQLGYYTEVAGLGASPTDVTINGTIDVYNQCDSGGSCVALVNFWRSMSNLTIEVAGKSGCQTGEFWATSQAAPMRRVRVDGPTTFMDYCTPPSFASGGFVADSQLNATVVNGSQQQYLVRDSEIGGWSNGVQRYEVIWNGERGRTISFQNEMPYDPPDQASYQHDGLLGWASYKVAPWVRTHEGWGLGSYSFFNVDPSIHASHAFEVPVRPGVKLHDILSLSITDHGTIDHVVNDFGAPTSADTTPNNVVEYPPPP